MIADGRTAAEVALAYTDMGWSPIPIPPRQKAPIIDGWQHLRVGAPDIARLFNNQANIGVLLGEPSGGLVDVDLDHVLAIELADAYLPATALEFGRASRPRSHRLYRVTDIAETHKRQAKTHGMLVELRSSGCQTVFPGSIHPSGEPIVWSSNGEPTEITADALRRAVDALADAVEQRLGIVRMPPARRNKAEGNDDRRLERARKYIAKMAPAISGQGGHNATFEVAAALCRFGLSEGDAEALLGEYNERCEPPWSDHELQHKLRDANDAVRAAGEFGILIEEAKPAKGKRRRLIAIDARSSAAGVDRLPDDCPSLKMDNGRTDHANAQRFAGMHGENVRWCEAFGRWIIWDGLRWAPDNQRTSEALAKDVANAIWKWAGENLNQLPRDVADEVVSFARYSASARGLGNMLALARSEAGIAIQPEALDADPWALNCANGIVDLRTGELGQHRRELYLTKLCPVSFEPGAMCPRWLATLNRIMAADDDLIRFLQRLAGASLVGKTIEHILPFCYGTGANGKSLFLGAMLDCLGPDYAMKGPPDLLVVKKGEAHPTERADLKGKRLVACIEAEDGRRLAEGLVKELTGGDKIRARFMRQDFFEFEPSHTVWLAANHKPVIRGNDNGIWRRVKMIPFTVTIPESEQDKRLPEKLRHEFPGILSWMIRGCLDWQANGLGEPAAVKVATGGYRAEMDVLGLFIEERTVEGNAFKVKASELYRTYCEWCKASNEHPQNQRRFGQAMSDRGFQRYTNNGTWYEGIGIMVTEGTEGSGTQF